MECDPEKSKQENRGYGGWPLCEKHKTVLEHEVPQVGVAKKPAMAMATAEPAEAEAEAEANAEPVGTNTPPLYKDWDAAAYKVIKTKPRLWAMQW